VVVKPSGGSSRLRLGPWLRARYGIEEVQTITLSREAWRRLASEDAVGVDPVPRDRLALSLLCRPELVVVYGCETSPRFGERLPTSREDVERAVHRIHSLRLPANVLGVRIAERRGDAPYLTDPEGAGRSVEAGPGEAADTVELSVFTPHPPEWLAEQVREDDGGRVTHESVTRDDHLRPRRRTLRRAPHAGRAGMRRGRFSVAHWRLDGGRPRVRAHAPATAGS
jgi:hypothetical protein